MGEIASQLGVEAILEGTVSRSGNKVRVTTQLIYTPTDAHLWAESYVRDVNDVFDLQKYVARSEADPDDAGLHYGKAETYKYKHMDKEAFGEFEIALQLSGRAAEIPEVEKAFAKGGLRAVSRLDFLRLQGNAKKTYVSPLKIAGGYAELGDKEQTIRYLQLALRERAPQLVRVHIKPEFDFVRSDPRFLEILANVGLKSPRMELDWTVIKLDSN